MSAKDCAFKLAPPTNAPSMSSLVKNPAAFFLVHGEQKAKEDLAAAISKEVGFDPVIVSEMSEYELVKQGATTLSQTLEDIVDEDDLAEMKNRIAEIRSSLETLLYQAELASSNSGSAERVAEINNKLLALEKDTVGLASTIART